MKTVHTRWAQWPRWKPDFLGEAFLCWGYRAAEMRTGDRADDRRTTSPEKRWPWSSGASSSPSRSGRGFWHCRRLQQEDDK